MRHFLEIDDLNVGELKRIMELAAIKDPAAVLSGHGVSLLFEKPSNRTRNSMELAVFSLGGHPIYMRDDELGLGTRESVEDVTRTLASYHACVAARVFDHTVLERMASLDLIPVINLLSDSGHPMQALADVLTLMNEFGDLTQKIVTFIGDGNNVFRSLALATGLLGATLRFAGPSEYRLSDADRDRLAGLEIFVSEYDEALEAVDGADVVYTDVWTSMGQEEETERRNAAFKNFQVNEKLMAVAASSAVFLHCLPAHRGQEVSDEVIDGASSRVWLQAANRMHAARGLLLWLFEEEMKS